METWEIEISALLDGELEPDRVLPLFDAMARDAELRQFYVQARALEGVILSTGAAAETEPAPAGLWSRIRADVGEAGPDRD
ncbi:MAG: hypothetical protein KC729_06945, partial [Candidatus Eisenbacteria bacterium]|nr:hypothetical protein [Candidatus Eisenbacteria bacterium]